MAIDRTPQTARKPVTPGRRPEGFHPQAKPPAARKVARQARLVAKGVPLVIAQRLVGVGEDLTAAEIDERRIAWQKTLPKG